MPTRRLGIAVRWLVTLWRAACGSKQPNLGLETDTFDFGDVVNGDIVSREVVVRNEGRASLVVEAVTTSCGCTTATLEPMPVPAGGTATLHIEFDSGAHGPDANGELMRQVFVASNDPDQPEAQVRFTANVLPRSGS